jgi:hypothetical protein
MSLFLFHVTVTDFLKERTRGQLTAFLQATFREPIVVRGYPPEVRYPIAPPSSMLAGKIFLPSGGMNEVTVP